MFLGKKYVNEHPVHGETELTHALHTSKVGACNRSISRTGDGEYQFFCAFMYDMREEYLVDGVFHSCCGMACRYWVVKRLCGFGYLVENYFLETS